MGKELDNVRGEKVTLKIGGKEREIKFTFKAWAELEKDYGGIKKLQENLEKDINEHPLEKLPHLLYIGLMDKEGVTEDNILDDYGFGDIEFIADVLGKALYNSMPQDNSKMVVEAKK